MTTALDHYDALLLDLDGTVYRGSSAVAGAEQAIRAAQQAGVTVRFVTNNASRTPQAVADHLNNIGVPAKANDVSTSAQAAAAMLTSRVAQGAEVLILGTEALAGEAESRGYKPVRQASKNVAAVLQGLSQELSWKDLAEASVAIRSGALWIASNVDLTLPTERGLLPGNGALVTALKVATEAEPLVAGKPARPLMDEAIQAAGATKPLAVGDRLDTDIEGARNAEIDALLVFTGVDTPATVLAAPPNQRPQYIANNLTAVQTPLADLEITEQPTWRIETKGTDLHLHYTGTDADPDPLSALRALCAAWWRNNTGPAAVHPQDRAAEAAHHQLFS